MSGFREKLNPVTIVISTTSLVIGVLTIWFFVTTYVDGVAKTIKDDYIERDLAVVQKAATTSGQRNRDLRTIMEQTHLDGYRAVLDVVDRRNEIVARRIRHISKQAETPVRDRELELLLDESEHLTKISSFVKELMIKADKIWEPK